MHFFLEGSTRAEASGYGAKRRLAGIVVGEPESDWGHRLPDVIAPDGDEGLARVCAASAAQRHFNPILLAARRGKPDVETDGVSD